MKKKGQFWYMDFIVAIIIMSVIALLFVKTVIGMAQTKNMMDDLMIEAQELSENLMSERVGLTYGNNELDKSKFIDFANKDYGDLKIDLGTNKEFYVFLTDGTSAIPVGTSGSIIGIGPQELIAQGLGTVEEVRAAMNQKVTSREVQNIIEINRLVTVNQGTIDDPKIEVYRLTILIWSKKG
jgi:hypothetical protein